MKKARLKKVDHFFLCYDDEEEEEEEGRKIIVVVKVTFPKRRKIAANFSC